MKHPVFAVFALLFSTLGAAVAEDVPRWETRDFRWFFTQAVSDLWR